MVDTLDSKYGILEKLDRIEDKVLERGSFTKILGKEFTLSSSIEEVPDDEDNGHCFDLIIRITSPKKTLNDEKAEEIADYFGNHLFELVKEELGEEKHDEFICLLRESQLFFNDKRLY